jgi:hypothetical protein
VAACKRLNLNLDSTPHLPLLNFILLFLQEQQLALLRLVAFFFRPSIVFLLLPSILSMFLSLSVLEFLKFLPIFYLVLALLLPPS